MAFNNKHLDNLFKLQKNEFIWINPDEEIRRTRGVGTQNRSATYDEYVINVAYEDDKPHGRWRRAGRRPPNALFDPLGENNRTKSTLK